MTPLRPAGFVAKSVASRRYPINKKCAHPECDKDAESVHHIWGRPDGESYYVALHVEQRPDGSWKKWVVPHAVKLCGDGTRGHHGDVEEHRSWIEFREDGTYVWYDRIKESLDGYARMATVGMEPEWEEVGPLDPQPAQGDKVGRPRKKNTEEEKKKVDVLAFRSYKGAPEDWAGQIVEALDRFEDLWMATTPGLKRRTKGATLLDAVLAGLLYAQDR